MVSTQLAAATESGTWSARKWGREVLVRMNMSTQAKFFMVFIIGLFIQLLIGYQVLGHEFSLETALPFFSWTITWSYLCWKIKCPKCKSPYVIQDKTSGMSFCAGIFRGRCSACNADLSKQ